MGAKLELRNLRESIALWTGLEELHLEDCTRLERLPPQVCVWKSLRRLSLKNCWSLKSLPVEVSGWTSVVEADFSQCGSLIELPIGCQNWKKIEEMRLDDCTRMESLSDGARQWTCLRVLEMASCHMSVEVGTGDHVWPLLQRTGLDCSLYEDVVTYEGLFGKASLSDVTLCGEHSLEELPSRLLSCSSICKLTLYAAKLRVLEMRADCWAGLQKLKLVGCTDLGSLPST
jgi:hypothetical protein